MKKQYQEFAVVGMDCRFPGAENYHQFWENLENKRSSIREVPKDRWRWEDYYGDPDTTANRTKVKWGGFISDIDKFDPMFFGISPKEAACIDPQHRLFLMSAWKSIEDAGYNVETLSGREIGVYAGVSKNDYAELMRELKQDIAPFVSTGTVHSILSNRVSFLFDFHGRSESVDTACSSGLVALHNAMGDIASGECEAAIVGGVNALLAPTMYLSHSKSGMLSIDGECKTFDEGANGYVRAEGVGTLFIKPLHRALEDGDHIHAVIKGSAINHGGRANFLTSPTVAAQSEVIQKAFNRAQVDPSTITYVEAHGTGTPMGDPIEISALKDAYVKAGNTQANNEAYCALSAVKTNVGHLESASGIAGIIKTILSLQHKKIPALQNFKRLNPYLDLEGSPFFVADKNIAWDRITNADGEVIPRRASVSSFGMGGVNGHVILEEAPAQLDECKHDPKQGTLILIPLSSKNKNINPYLQEVHDFMLRNTHALSSNEKNNFLTRLAYTLSCGRSQMPTRLAFMVSSLDGLIEKVDRYLKGGADIPGCIAGHVKVKRGEKPQVLHVEPIANMHEVASAWVSGGKLDWSAFYSSHAHPRRLPLPTYMFAKKRCWFSDDIVRPKDAKISRSELPKPLRRYQRGVNMDEAVFSKMLTGQEFYLRDHVVQGTKFLPGVVYLELARAVTELGGLNERVISIRDVYWLKPVAVSDKAMVIGIRLNKQLKEDGSLSNEIQYEVRIGGDTHGKGILIVGGEKDIYPDDNSTGFLTKNRLSLESIEQEIEGGGNFTVVDKPALYKTFQEFGLSYGESFRPIASCRVSDSAVLTKLIAPEITRGEFSDFILHPTMMDGVFQSIVSLTILGQAHTDYQYVPFSLERIEILGEVVTTQWVYATASSIQPSGDGSARLAPLAMNDLRYDAVLMDESGKVVIKFYGLQKRAIGAAIKGKDMRGAFKKPATVSFSPAPSFDVASAEIQALYYRSIFVPMPLGRAGIKPVIPTPTAILVLSNRENIRDEVKRSLDTEVPVFVVSTGAKYHIHDAFNLAISPNNNDDFSRLVMHIKSQKITISHVLHMWNMDSDGRRNNNKNINNDTEAEVKGLGIYAILSLSQALMKKRAYKKIKMVYCYSENDSEQRPSHAMVAGFARTLIYENPNINILTLGLSGHGEETGNGKDGVTPIAMAELLHDANAKLHEIRFIGGIREIRQVIGFDESMRLPRSEASVFRKGGTYIFSGGAGGLGVIFSTYLAKTYQANIILLGRSSRNQKINSICDTIENFGGQSDYFSADISDATSMSNAMEKIREQYPVIHGVIHAAGVIEDAYIIRKSYKSFQKVIETKTSGARHLDVLTKNDDLDFFMMFSSIAALMPNQGQSDYAAANSYLDYFSAYRNQLVNEGLRRGVSVAINWPLWADGGMGVTQEEEEHLLKVFGMKPLETPLGIEVLESTLKFAKTFSYSQKLDQVFVIDGDKEKISSCLGMVAAMPKTINVTKDRAVGVKQPGAALSTSADTAVPTNGANRMTSETSKDDVKTPADGKETVLALFAKYFDIAQANIDTSANFSEFGVDSMVMISIAKDINAYFGLDIKPIVFFEVNTIDKFIEHLALIAGERFTAKKIVAEDSYVKEESPSIPLHNRSLIDPSISTPQKMTFKRRFNVDEFYLKDHVVEDQYNMPGACYIEMARQCGDQLFGDGAVKGLVNNYWVSQLSSPKSDFDAYVHIAKKEDVYEYEVVSYGDYPNTETKKLHAMGQFYLASGKGFKNGRPQSIDLEGLRQRCLSRQTPDTVYPQIIAEGLHVGPTFMPMSEILLGKGEAMARLHMPTDISDTHGDYVLHPTMLTGVFQTALISNRYDKENTSRQYIPISIDEIALYGPIGPRCIVVSKASERNPKNKQLKKFDLSICADNGEVLAQLSGFSIRALKESAQQPAINEGGDVMQNTDPSILPGGNKPLVDPSELTRLTESYIKGLLSGPVGLSEDEIESDQEFDTYGINSVMIVELNKLFENTFGPLSKTLFFEYANVAELAEYFVADHQDRLIDILDVSTDSQSVGRVSIRDAQTDDIVGSTSIVERDLLTAQESQQGNIVENVHSMLKELLSEPLGLSVEDIDVDESFESYGINSVMIVELNKRFETQFGPLSKTLFFEYGNIDELSEYFIDNHRDVLLASLGLAGIDVKAETENEPQNVSPKNLAHDSLTPQSKPPEEQHSLHKPGTDKPQATSQDIAIIGVAGRYPEASNLDQFWKLLKEGRDCIKEVPQGHFDGDLVFDANPERDKIYSKLGGFIDDVDKFDAAFFNISPREAELIDPQERIFLEVTWSALEDAGYTPESLRDMSDREVGVFVGALWQPYQSIGTEETLRGNAVAPSGLLYSIANRISYYLNLSGPSLAIDTACSASLTAVHMACQSIRSGDCKVAIAGGVNLSLHSSKYLFLSQNRFLSTDGRCRSFGDGGDGYVPGEGVGSILLKPLEDAIKDNDQIYAVINGSAVNHGGKTHGYSVPNPNAQAALIQKTLERSDIDPRSISYVEAHGTGTPLGDPIEITGLKKAFQTKTKDKQFCAIGSVKSNIGHLEAAAGIAAITKTVLQMKHNTLVPSIHADDLNKNIDFADSPFHVQRSIGDWEKSDVDQRRRAGISSFGAGGANAHIILAQYEGGTHSDQGADYRTAGDVGCAAAPAIIVLSAKNDDRLNESAANLKSFLEESLKSGASTSFESLVFTLQVGRQAMSSRLAIITDSVEDLCLKLSGFIDDKNKMDGVYAGHSESKSALSLFSGDDDISIAIDAWVAKSKIKKIAQLWVSGFTIDWRSYYADQQPQKMSLPTYPFEKLRYWLPEGSDADKHPALGERKLHPLIHKNTSTLRQQQFLSRFDGREFFLDDHRVGADRILPAVAYIEMFRAAAALSDETASVYRLNDLTWTKPIVVGNSAVEDSAENIEIVLTPDHDTVSISAQVSGEDGAMVHCAGTVVYAEPHSRDTQDRVEIGAVIKTMANNLDAPAIYRVLHDKGLNLRAGFQGLEWLKWNQYQAIGKISLPQSTASDNRSRYSVHPSLLDSALQVALSVLETQHALAHTLYLPLSIEEVTFFDDLPDDVYSVVSPSDHRSMVDSSATVRAFDVSVCDAEGRILLHVKNIAFKETNMASGSIRSQYEQTEDDSQSRITYSSFDWVTSSLGTALEQHASNQLATQDTLKTKRKNNRALIVSNCEDLVDNFLSSINDDEDYELCETILVCDKPVVAQRNRVILRPTDAFESVIDLLTPTDQKVDQFIFLWESAHEVVEQDEERGAADESTVLLEIVFNLNRKFALASYAQSQIFVMTSGENNKVYEYTSEHIIAGAIAGYIKSLSAEYPKLASRLIAIPKHVLLKDNALLNRELADVVNSFDQALEERSQWVCYQALAKTPVRYIKRMASLAPGVQGLDNVEALSGIRHKGCYLISGGMGGIGKRLSRYLSDKYSATLILLGRSELNEGIESHLSQLKASGGKAFYFPVDISDIKALTLTMEDIRVKSGHLDGVIHAAGKIEDNFLCRKNTPSFNAVLLPKIAGTVNLDLVTRKEPLDFFMGFSSLTAVFGNIAQCDYGAANGFLDAYMGYRSECEGAPGLSLGINWPLWRDGGMGTSSDDVDIEDGLDARFGRAIEQKVGLKCFEQSLFLGRSQIIVVQENLQRKDHKLNEQKIVGPGVNYESTYSKKSVDSVENQHVPIKDADIETKLYEDVRDIIAKKGKFDPQRIRPSDNFIALGLESVFLTSLAGQINKKYGVRLSPATFFEHSSLDALVGYMLSDYAEAIHAFFSAAQAGPVSTPSIPMPSVSTSKNNAGVATNVNASFPKPSFRNGLQGTRYGSENQLKASNNKVTQDYEGKYAIVGMDCLFPGASDLESFWDVLANGKSMISEIPKDRWDWESIYGDPAQEVNKTNIKWGGFVEDLDKFDPAFFNISPREAALMDPQQRIVLQSVWKAIEHAGYAPLSLSESHKVGLFLGASTNDYFELLAKRDVEAYSSTGGVHSITANRVSYLLDFKGPSIPVDTACSSSLVALDMAVKALEDGQCDAAIVGGVNALITPTLYVAFSKAGMLSPTGIISPLDKNANGYVRGEGVGVLVLKKLARAIQDNDTVHAVVRGTAVNHGGRVSSLTVPNPNAQADLILDACDKAKVDVTTLSFIEMHGTGTPLGDPVEVNGLKKAFKQGEAVKEAGYCGISSVKGNLGHLEAAAGIAGVIKTVLSLQHKTQCAQGNFNELNPHIQLDGSPFKVVARTGEWAHIKNAQGELLPRRAGVSSFGFGGANAHTILEEYVVDAGLAKGGISNANKESRSLRFPELSNAFVLSAKTDNSLRNIASNLKDFLMDKRISHMTEVSEQTLLNDIAFTLQTGRSPMAHRLAIQASSLRELIACLAVYLSGSDSHKSDRSQEKGIFIGEGREFDGEAYRYEESSGLAECLDRWVAGADINWLSYYPAGSCQRIPLPTYVFARERYWLAPEVVSTEHVAASDLSSQSELSRDSLKDFCVSYLTSIAAKVLQTPPSKIKCTSALDQYGMDSMMVIQVVNTLKADFKDIDSVVLMRYRSIEALSEYFIKEYKTAITALYNNRPNMAPVQKVEIAPDHQQIEVSGIAQDLADGKFDFKDAIQKIRGISEKEVNVVNGDSAVNRETV
ncbi:MAG: SDR family NAD(P)-dependent oxidoreductase [Agarilytica sp.]